MGKLTSAYVPSALEVAVRVSEVPSETTVTVAPGMTLPEMALRFILSHPAVSTTIAGMRKAEHVRQNIAASDAGALDQNLLAELKKHRWDRTPQRWSD